MSNQTTITGYPFVKHVDQEARPEMSVESGLRYFKTGGMSFNGEQIRDTGFARLMGYRYDFRPFVKKFIYKQYGQWHEAFAPNKTALRKATYGRSDQIIEA